MNMTRRHFSGPEKVAILKRHLLEKVPVSDLCDELDIGPNLFYRWQKEFFENGHAAFQNDRKSKALEDAREFRGHHTEFSPRVPGTPRESRGHHHESPRDTIPNSLRSYV